MNGPTRPTQAVILAGGRGTRLQPITNTRPKAMVGFHGKPFLEHLIERLRDEGIERVLLLLGYLPEVIQDHFEDGSRLGVEIEYSVTGPDDLTVHRMRVAEPLLDDTFLLLYCDNYWPLQLGRLWARFEEAGAPALVTVYSNRDGYTRDSVIVDGEGFVTVYDRGRTTPGLSGVEIGYAILTRPVLDLMPRDHDELFEAAVYPPLATERKLAAYVTDHRYYSVGSHERLPLTNAFLAGMPTVVLDRDGVLNRRPPRAQYVRSWEEWQWLPGALESLKLLADSGYRVLVVSNQAGINRGAMSEADVLAVHERMRAEAAAAGGRIDAVYYCPHDWDEGCECRKPKPGMLFQAQRDHHLDLTHTPFIGDDERDAEAAEAAGAPFELVTDERPLLDIVNDLVMRHGKVGVHG
jgi:D-glycero-D-manno-heptose 1,7-bisphosphate phosphatase